jgi:hypothetical protein
VAKFELIATLNPIVTAMTKVAHNTRGKKIRPIGRKISFITGSFKKIPFYRRRFSANTFFLGLSRLGGSSYSIWVDTPNLFIESILIDSGVAMPAVILSYKVSGSVKKIKSVRKPRVATVIYYM